MPKLISQKNYKGILTASLNVNSTDQVVLDIFSKNLYRTIKYYIQVQRGSSYHTTEINLTHDGTNVYTTEFGTITSNGILCTFDADIVSSNVRLLVTPNTSESTTIKLLKTSINS